MEHLEQFYLDVPRMDIYIEGVLNKEEPCVLRDYIYNNFDKDTSNLVIFLLTQTFIAKFYIDEYHRKKQDDIHNHLFDGGNLIASIDKINKMVHIEKDFKLIVIIDDLVYLTNYCTLNIDINLEEKTTVYSWNYDFESLDDPMVINLKTDHHYLV